MSKLSEFLTNIANAIRNLKLNENVLRFMFMEVSKKTQTV